jgi:NAD-dependent SIR2 family protein deacetylase
MQRQLRRLKKSSLVIVVASSYVVPKHSMTLYNEIEMRSVTALAVQADAPLVIINQGDTPFDAVAHLRFRQAIGEVLPPAVNRL